MIRVTRFNAFHRVTQAPSRLHFPWHGPDLGHGEQSAATFAAILGVFLVTEVLILLALSLSVLFAGGGPDGELARQLLDYRQEPCFSQCRVVPVELRLRTVLFVPDVRLRPSGGG